MVGSASVALMVFMLAGPPEEEALSNRPASVSDRPVRRETVDPSFRPAAAVPVTPVPTDTGPAPGPLDPVDEVTPMTRVPRKISPATRPLGRTQRSTDDGDGETSPLPTTRSLAWWSTTGVGLFAVLLSIFLAGRVLKRAIPGAAIGETSGPIQLLHRSFLSPKHTVCLVRVGDRMLLVGVSGDRMQTLSEIHDPQEIDFIRGQLMQIRPRSTTQAFRDILSGRGQLSEATLKGSVAADEALAARPAEVSPARMEDHAVRKGEGTAFIDHLSSLRDQIARFKSKARET